MNPEFRGNNRAADPRPRFLFVSDTLPENVRESTHAIIVARAASGANIAETAAMTLGSTISVIMPAHNAEAYIDVALRSLRDQDYEDLDIIVVDDGSVDSTRAIALSHAEADSRVRVVALPVASGRPSTARNAGIRAARGHYIAFLDADDIALPGRFSESMMAMNATGATVVFADLERLYADERGVEATSVLRQRAFIERASDYLDPVAADVYRCRPDFVDFMVMEFEAVNTQTILFDRRVLTDAEAWFDESLLCAEDLDLFYRIAQQGCVGFLDKVFTQYRIHSGSLTHSRPTQALLDATSVRLRYFIQHATELGPTQSVVVRHRIAAAFADAGYGFWVTGEARTARSAILQSARLHPTWRAGWAYCKSFIRHDSAVIAWVRRILEAQPATASPAPDGVAIGATNGNRGSESGTA